MGLENSKHVIYCSIMEGQVIRKVSSKTETSRERTNKNNVLVHEEHYEKLSGKMVGLDIVESQEYGKFINVYMEDDGQTYCLQFGLTSGYGTAFLKTLPNVNIKERFTIIPSLKKEGEVSKSVIFINQGSSKALKRYYTNDTPHGMPQPVETRDRKTGKKTWDYWEQTEFLVNNVVEPIKKILGNKPVEKEPVYAPDKNGNLIPAHIPDEPAEGGGPDDDLPF